MAINKIAYFPNPTLGKTLGQTQTLNLTGTATDTVLTVAASNEYKYVKSFVLKLTFLSGGVSDEGYAQIKIGSAYYRLSTDSGHAAGDLVEKTVYSSDIGFNGGFLAPSDTITVFTSLTDTSGNATLTSQSIVVVDDYYTA